MGIAARFSFTNAFEWRGLRSWIPGNEFLAVPVSPLIDRWNRSRQQFSLAQHHSDRSAAANDRFEAMLVSDFVFDVQLFS